MDQPRGTHLHGEVLLSTAADAAALLQKSGWSIRKSGFTEFQANKDETELYLQHDQRERGAIAPVLVHGPSPQAERVVQELAEIFRKERVVFSFEVYDSAQKLVATVTDQQRLLSLPPHTPPPPTAPEKDSPAGGCSLGCAGLFVLMGLIWPMLHLVGGTYEPETLFVPFLFGVPAFIVGNILALLAVRSRTSPSYRLGVWALRVMWGLIALWIVLAIAASAVEKIQHAK